MAAGTWPVEKLLYAVKLKEEGLTYLQIAVRLNIDSGRAFAILNYEPYVGEIKAAKPDYVRFADRKKQKTL